MRNSSRPLLGVAAPLVPVLLATVLLSIGPAANAADPPATDAWVPFTAHWSAAGTYKTLLVGGREAVTVHLSGSFTVTSESGPSKGFRAEAIAFDDGEGISIGRLVLTDEKGEQVFCRVEGQAVATGKEFVASFTGGTGRYAGIQGGFRFRWQFIVKNDDGTFQGRSVELKGQYRHAPAGEARR